MIATEDLSKLIQLYPVLGELPASLQHAFLSESYPVHAVACETVVDLECPNTAFFMLLEGGVTVVHPGVDHEFLLYRIRPGGVCMLLACHMLTEANFPVQYEAETEIRGVAVPQPLFKQMVEGAPLFASFLFDSFSGRLTRLLELLEVANLRRMDQRLAGMLLIKGDHIRITHAQLAEELGSAREVISRILKDFEDKGLLKRERGLIHILNKKSLTHLHRFGD